MVIFVTGLHHSGTTVLAKFVEACGAKPVGKDFRPSKSHPQGYKEASNLTRLAEKALNDLGYTWYNPPKLPPSHLFMDLSRLHKNKDYLNLISFYDSFSRSDYVNEITTLVKGDTLYYVKDPRLTIFAAGLDVVLKEYHNKYVFFYTYRNRLKCIKSLKKEYSNYLDDKKVELFCEQYKQYQNVLSTKYSYRLTTSFEEFILRLRSYKELHWDWVKGINYSFKTLNIDKIINKDDPKIIKEMFEFTKDYKIEEQLCI